MLAKDFEKFPDNARVWVYGAEKSIAGVNAHILPARAIAINLPRSASPLQYRSVQTWETAAASAERGLYHAHGRAATCLPVTFSKTDL